MAKPATVTFVNASGIRSGDAQASGSTAISDKLHEAAKNKEKPSSLTPTGGKK